MTNNFGSNRFMRWLAAMLLCILPLSALAQGSANVTASVSSETPHPSYGGYINILQGSSYSMRYSFNVSPTYTPTSVDPVSYTFGSTSGTLSAMVLGGQIVVADFVVPSNLAPGEYTFTYTINYKYSSGQSATIRGTASESVRVVARASSSGGTTDLPMSMAGTAITLGPVSYTGGTSGGWRITWSDGSPSGNPATTCRYTPTAPGGAVTENTVTALVENLAPDNTTVWYSETYTYRTTTYGRPTASMDESPTGTFSNTPVTLRVKAGGGNPEGWNFKWREAPSNNSPELTVTPVNNGTTTISQSYRVDVTNTSPDGSLWYENTFAVTLNVYPTPNLSFGYSGNRTTVFTDEVITLSNTVSGGQSGHWVFEWSVNGQPVAANGSSYDFVVPAVTESPTTYTVGCSAYNAAEGVQDPQRFDNSVVFRAYPKPNVEAVVPLRSALFEGQSTNLSVSATGGVADGWRYTWTTYHNGSVISTEANTTSHSKKVDASKVSAQYSYLYRCEAKNMLDGNVNYSETFDFTVDFYPAPNIKPEWPTRANFVDGETIRVPLTMTGGSDNSWGYSWFLNGTDLRQSNPCQYEAVNTNDSGSRDYTLTLNAYNRPNYIINEYTFSDSFKYKVWPKPVINGASQSEINVFSGQEFTLAMYVSGGVEGGWVYEWQKNGAAMAENTSSITLKAVNDGTSPVVDTYTLNVRNVADGQTIVSKRSTFTVTIYSGASVEFTETYPEDIMVGDAVPMGVRCEGGDPSGWTYTWRVDDKVDGYQSTYNYYATVSGAHTVSVEAANSLGNAGGTPVPFTLSHTFNVWAVPQIITTTERNMQMFPASSTTLAVDISGGVSGGWECYWTLNGETVSSGDAPYNLDVVIPENAGGQVLNYEYHATNRCGDRVVFDQVIPFEIQVVEQPSVVISPSSIPNNVVVGTVIPLSIETKGGNPDGWEITWNLDAVLVSEGRSYTYIAANETDQPVEQLLSVVYKNTLANGQEWYDSYVHTFKVWTSTAVTTEPVQNIPTHNGATLEIGVDAVGGEDGSWRFTWAHNGTAMPTATTARIPVTVANTGTSMLTDTYTVHAVNMIGGETGFEGDYVINLQVYPDGTATASSERERYYIGENARLYANFSGGYPEGWMVEWSIGGTGATVEKYVENKGVASYSETIYATVSNGYNGDVWYSFVLPVSYEAYSRGDIWFSSDTTQVYQTVNRVLTVETQGGYPRGWNYSWNDGYTSGNAASFTANFTNSTRQMQRYTVNAAAYNAMDGIRGSEAEGEFVFDVWPVVIAPEGLELSRTAIREGSSVQISLASAPSGGYQPYGNTNWNYSWYQGRNLVSTEPTFSVNSVNLGYGTDKLTSEVNYSLRLENYGPTGEVWFRREYNEQTVTVYRAPSTPTEMLRKGNGTSHMMIVMCSVSNEVIAEQEYQFVFGYTDPYGNETSFAPTPYRYMTYPEDIYNDSSYRFWVYAQWYYPDGSLVTSGRRYLDGSVDESFSASEFSGGRGTDSIDELLAGELEFDGFSFSARPATPAPARVTVYDITGKAVRVLHWDAAPEFDETIDLGNLVAGMYIVELRIGDLRAVRKVVAD